MSVPTFAFGRSKLSAPVVAIASGEGFITAAKAGNYYFTLQGQNVVGLNLQSDIVGPIAVAEDDKIDITIPDDWQNGEDWHYFVVSMSDSNDPTTFSRVAYYRGYANDRATRQPLPATIELSRDEHLEMQKVVSAIALGEEPTDAELEAALPSSLDLVPGMVRGVSDTGFWYIYHPWSSLDTSADRTVIGAATGAWYRIGSALTFVSSLTDPGACGQDIRDISDLVVDAPDYSVDTGGDSAPMRYWALVPPTSGNLETGSRIGLVIQYGESDRTRSLAQFIKVRFLGYVNLSTGQLDTSDGLGGQMAYVGMWQPYNAAASPLIVQKDVPSGSAYAFEVQFFMPSAMAAGNVALGGFIKIKPVDILISGEFVETPFFDNTVYSVGDLRRVVPGYGSSLMILSGGYIVQQYSLRFLGEELVADNIALNTDNQQVFINGMGATWVAAAGTALPAGAGLRAVFGTVDGLGQAYPAVTVNAGVPFTSLDITVHNPYSETTMYGTVRPDYSDVAIAGSAKARFNPVNAIVYVEYGGVTRSFTVPITLSETQVVNITDFSAGTLEAGGLPAYVAGGSFGLFTPVLVQGAASGGVGGMGSGAYKVTVRYEYADTITRISHDPLLGCLVEAPGDSADMFGLLRVIHPPVQTKQELRDIAPGDRPSILAQLIPRN